MLIPLMHRKPKYLEAEQGAQRDRWLISYADFITILLILFAAIAAQGLRPNLPPEPAPKTQFKPVSKAGDSRQLLAEAAQKLKLQGLDSRLEKRGVVISLPQAVLFPSGEDRVMPAAFPLISEIAAVLDTVPNQVVLVGHSDAMPIHNRRFRNNWELSAARSVNLLQILSVKYGLPESRLSVQSFGSNQPRDSNDTEAGRAENRRVEILLLDESSQ